MFGGFKGLECGFRSGVKPLNWLRNPGSYVDLPVIIKEFVG